ncbi:MAG: S8 family serine peptidase [Actinomycetota bacterium]|nr:S8 family serine peptidase [Actinomycetota bacterium]
MLVGLGVGSDRAVSQEPGQVPEGSADVPSFRPSGGEEFASDRILVKLKDGVPDRALEVLNRQNNAESGKKLAHTRVDVVKLPRELPVEAAVKRYEASPDVEYAEPDFVFEPSQTTSANDPSYPKLYGLNNTGQTGGTAGADINAPEAWSTTTGDAEVVVAVIDTGTDTNHPDLKNNLWTNPGETAANGVDDDNNGYVDDVDGWDFYNNDATVYDAADGDKHGTHVAGTIAGQGNNDLGVVGVNWKAKIMPLKFLGPNGGYTSDAVEAINYAVAKGAKISNNSWGGGGYSQTLKDAIHRADASGHLFVAAAGNGGSDGVGDDNDATPHYPSSYDNPNLVSVAATDSKDALAGFSNYGAASVDLSAPGVSILSTLPGDTYGGYSGTSMATPHVSGVAALLKSKNPTADDATIKEQILKSVDARSNLSGKTATGGRLNAAGALGVESTELGFAASPLTVNYGAATLLSGRLTSSGEPLPDKQVVLEQRPVGASDFSPVTNGARTTDADGKFSLAGVVPSKHTDYRARFAGEESSGLPASTSIARRVSVKALVSLSTATTNLKLGKSRAVSGSVGPAHTGSVKVAIKRNGALLTTKTLTLSSSKYGFTYKPTSTGTYTFSASFGGDTDHLGNTSVARSFKVVK